MIIFIVSLLVFLGFQNPKVHATTSTATAHARPLGTIMRQPVFLMALFSSAISYGIMSFIMTATPISMSHLDGFSFEQSKQVIQWHLAAMFLPSVFNIFLFRFLSIPKLMLGGAIIYLIMTAVALGGHQYLHYNSSLILLGVGWNFLFVAGTTLLPQSYSNPERFKVQAANDFIVFAVQGAASLGAGWLLFAVGWDNLIKVTLPFTAFMLVLAVVYYWQTLKQKR
jgi:hypothetical protein